MPRTALKSAAVKKISPAYITPTNRLLFESDESASIVLDASSTCASEYSVMAGTRYRFWRTKVRLPAKPICTSSSVTAGTKVTNTRKTKSTASLPATYSQRLSGLAR